MPHAHGPHATQPGSCQCGQVRFLAPRQPLALYVCHCTECRKQSASAFGISFKVPRRELTLLQGRTASWTRDTASGHRLECVFCVECGSRLWHQSSGSPDTLNIKGGALDEPVDLGSAIHIWTASQLPGVVIPAGALTFPGEPD
jgi:hypothetical protein